MRELEQARDDVARRTQAIQAARADWPCRKGCDECCRRLAAVPRVSEAEWREIARAADAGIRRRIRESARSRRPVTCPLLDAKAGACRVYAARPIECRAYGFYAEREGVLGCARIARIAEESRQVVWGNHAALEERLRALGPRKPLHEWLESAVE